MSIPQLSKGKDPFHVKVSVRSPQHAALIEKDCAEVTKVEY